VPGVVLREGVRQLAPTAAFARALLGSVGPATAEVVEQSGGRVRADQQVGCPGCRSASTRSSPDAGLTVEASRRAAPRDGPADDGARAGEPLQVTLDPASSRPRTPRWRRHRGQGRRAGRRAAQHRRRAGGRERRTDGPEPTAPSPAATRPGPPSRSRRRWRCCGRAVAGRAVACPPPSPSRARASRTPRARRSATRRSARTSRSPATPPSSAAPTASAPRSCSRRPATSATPSWTSASVLPGATVPVTDDAVQHAAQVIGQGKVLASPLSVAVSAAAVADGRLRPPRLLMATPAAAPGPALPEAGRAAHAHARGRRRGDRHRPARRAGGAGQRQDGHRGVRDRRAAAYARVVHRLLRRPGVRGAGGGRRLRRPPSPRRSAGELLRALR
jgi:hypothetical protein